MGYTCFIRNPGLSALTIQDLGIELEPGDNLEFSDLFAHSDIFDSLDLKFYIEEGEFIVNDGVTDLDIVDGLRHISLESVHEDVDGDVGFIDGGRADANYGFLFYIVAGTAGDPAFWDFRFHGPTYWEIFNSFGTWNAVDEQWESRDMGAYYTLYLNSIGTWNDEYFPTKWMLYTPDLVQVPPRISCWIYNTAGFIITINYNVIPGEYLTLNYGDQYPVNKIYFVSWGASSAPFAIAKTPFGDYQHTAY